MHTMSRSEITNIGLSSWIKSCQGAALPQCPGLKLAHLIGILTLIMLLLLPWQVQMPAV